MVVPNDAWCNTRGYMVAFNNQGAIEYFPDYESALLDNNLVFAISKIGQLMSDNGFPLKDLSMVMKGLREDEVVNDMTTSSEGDGLAETPRERLERVANADIIIELGYTINQVGPKYSLTYNLEAKDAYTKTQVAGEGGTGQQMFGGEFPVLLEKSIIENMDGFLGRLDRYFEELFEKGREVTLECRIWDSSDTNFESDFGGEELGFLIEEWIADNTVQGRFNTDKASENLLQFSQVRIPLANEKGRAIDTRYWANGLRRWLKQQHNIEAKLSIKGLGKAIITIGGK